MIKMIFVLGAVGTLTMFSAAEAQRGQTPVSGNPMTRTEAQTASYADIELQLGHTWEVIDWGLRELAEAANADDLVALKRSVGRRRAETGQIEAGWNDRLRVLRKTAEQEEIDRTFEVLSKISLAKVCMVSLNNGANELLSVINDGGNLIPLDIDTYPIELGLPLEPPVNTDTMESDSVFGAALTSEDAFVGDCQDSVDRAVELKTRS